MELLLIGFLDVSVLHDVQWASLSSKGCFYTEINKIRKTLTLLHVFKLWLEMGMLFVLHIRSNKSFALCDLNIKEIIQLSLS